jgi:hypothetical protein
MFRFSATVCGVLDYMLRSWIVDNREDEKSLLSCARQAGCRPPNIYKMRYSIAQYDIDPHMVPHESLATIMRFLKVRI